MKRKRESIDFECGGEFIIVPVERIERIFKNKGEAERAYIPKEELFPYGYMEYLGKVLNINRHLPEFSYGYIDQSPIRESGIERIMLRQLGKMMINGAYCFDEVKLFRYGGRMSGVEVKFGKGIRRREPGPGGGA